MRLIFIFTLSFSVNCFAQLTLNTQCQAILSDPQTGLISTSIDSFNYTYATRNTTAITTALSRLSRGQDLLLPEGVYYVETILLPSTLKGCIVSGTGIDKTVLRRKEFSWDNNTQGDCSLRTEIFIGQRLHNFELSNMTIDGNSPHIAISGYGLWNKSTGSYTNGTPQFPKYTSNDGYPASSGGVVFLSLSDSILFDNVNFKNGFRWCVFLGKVNGFQMRNSIIDTGNLSTEFRGHLDAAPNNVVMHMHTSQDGLHMVNVSNAIVEFNDIHSEDSAIAIELNPLWNWGGYDITENVIIRNNYISTASPSDPLKLLNNDDLIYGTGLGNKWVGQGAVDIFYNETFDVQGSISMGGANGTFRNIEISKNAFENVRYGVRCGFFFGAGQNNAESIKHRIYNLQIKDNNPNYLAGRDKNRPAGIRNVTKNEITTSWNLTGGAGIAVRHTDSLIVDNNVIKNCKGGLGVSVQDVTKFEIIDNLIDSIVGSDLGNNWRGGEGIRVYNVLNYTNDPIYGQYNANYFLIRGNKIGAVSTTKIAIINTKNGISRLNENYNLSGMNICKLADGINSQNTSNIDWGDCSSSGTDELKPVSNYKIYPNPVTDQLYVESNNINTTSDYVLLDYLGRQLYKYRSSESKVTIPVENLVSNPYLLIIYNRNNLTTTKIIKE